VDSVDLEVVRSALKWTRRATAATLARSWHTWVRRRAPVGAMLAIRDDGQSWLGSGGFAWRTISSTKVRGKAIAVEKPEVPRTG